MKQNKIIISIFLTSILLGFTCNDLHAQKKKTTLKGIVILQVIVSGCTMLWEEQKKQ